MDKEYKVIKPFTILDIYKTKPLSCQKFNREFEALLEESLYRGNNPWMKMVDIKYSEVLDRNLDWLEGKGFIKEKIVDPELKAGMKLKSDTDPWVFRIIDAQYDGLAILNGRDLLFNDSEKGSTLFLEVGSKLSDLNRPHRGWKFEVVNG